MGWSEEFMTDITLPTGATTGARIFLDGTSDRILVYDATGALVFSVAPDQGTDAQGNAYAAGATSYSNLGDASLQGGALLLGFGPDFTGAASLRPTIGGGAGQVLDSGTSSVSAPDSASLKAVAGSTGQTTGSTSAPRLQVRDGQSSSDTDLWISGSVIKTNAAGATEQWHVIGAAGEITYGTGWAAGPTSGSIQQLRYRKDGSDNLILSGAMHTTSTTPAATVFTLPAGYAPKVGLRVPLAFNSSNTITAGIATIASSGAVTVTPSPTVASQDVYVSALIPLGNLS